MAFISLQEILDLIIMTLAVGFIFKNIFIKHLAGTFEKNYDPLAQYSDNLKQKTMHFFQTPFFIAIIATAPAIIFHEMAHKFTALAYGIDAVFHASYVWLFIGIMLKLLNFGFIFFVPGYVTHAAAASPLTDAAIAFAGPLLNLILWIGAFILLKTSAVKGKWLIVLEYTKSINMFLFFFNMIPLGPFDGAHVFQGLFEYWFG